MTETFISVDIETDGPVPDFNSMLSLGAAAFQRDSIEPIATFEINLKPLPDATQDSDTMNWWKTQPEAWKHVTSNQVNPADAMRQFADWLKALPDKRPVFIGYPVTFDFTFVYWYYWAFVGKPPFGFQGLDIKTLAMDRLGLAFKQSAKSRFPKRWFRGSPKHTHKALDDAIGQGILFLNILNEEDPAHAFVNEVASDTCSMAGSGNQSCWTTREVVQPCFVCRARSAQHAHHQAKRPSRKPMKVTRDEFIDTLQRLSPEVPVRTMLDHGAGLPELTKNVSVHTFMLNKQGYDVEVLRYNYDRLLETGQWDFK